MEKTISFFEFQSVKSVAKAMDPYMRQYNKITNQIDTLEDEYQQKEAQAIAKVKERIQAEKASRLTKLTEEAETNKKQMDALEAGIVSIIGFHVFDLVKKVVETDGKGSKTTKYVPTDVVSYDSAAKQYVVTLPESIHEEYATTPENILFENI